MYSLADMMANLLDLKSEAMAKSKILSVSGRTLVNTFILATRFFASCGARFFDKT